MKGSLGTSREHRARPGPRSVRSAPRGNGPAADIHVRPSPGVPSPRPPLHFVDITTRISACPQFRPPPVFVLFFLRRDEKPVAVIGAVDCVDSTRSRWSWRAAACGQPWWRIGGWFGRSVDGFGPSRIHPQLSPVIPMVVPRLGPSCTQALGAAEAAGIALVSDDPQLWTTCGQPGESAWTTMGTTCGFGVSGMWIESGSSQLRDPLALWANCPHPGENPLCINKFEKFSVHRLWTSVDTYARFAPLPMRTHASAAYRREARQGNEKGHHGSPWCP